MKIELKKFKLVSGHNDDIPFKAEVHVDGKLAAYAQNDGWGGGTSFTPANKELFDKACDFAKAEHDAKNEKLLDGRPFTVEPVEALDIYLDKLINPILKETEQKKAIAKIKRQFKDKIIVGKPGLLQGEDGSYTFWKLNAPVAQYLANPINRAKLYNHIIHNIKPKIAKGEQILNDNLGGLV